MPRLFARTAIVLFVLWHMTAVAAYSIDPSWGIAPLNKVRNLIHPHIRGYILMTSQWQQWNLFSPDPLRRVSWYKVSHQNGSEWVIDFAIDDRLSMFERAQITKTLRRLEDRGTDDAVIRRFLTISCRELRLSEGVRVRLERMYHVLPKPPSPLSIAQWRSYIPQWSLSTMGEISCPPSV